MCTTGPSSEQASAKLDAFAAAILLRSAPGLGSVCLSWLGLPLLAGCALVLAVWSDVLIARWAGWKQWRKTPLHTQIEGFVDFTCFIWAPAQFLAGLSVGPALVFAAPVFVVCGVYRIARFNVEGLVNGRYRGLPVTYNGYFVPLAALGAHYAGEPYGQLICAGLLVVVSLLMVSSRLMVPEL